MSTKPEGLPPIADEARESTALEKSRVCPDCGSETRIVSNVGGLMAICGPCHKHWPISSNSASELSIPTMPRGLSKQTIVEPNWDLANQNLDPPHPIRKR